MASLNNDCFLPRFSHIYVESRIAKHPFAKKILSRFPRAHRIEIDHYKDVFGRRKQNFQKQKKAMKLILAHNSGRKLYEGPDVCHDFGNRNFYYTSSVLNCVYNCEYCFLQGMFPSGHLVMFVNLEDYFAEVENQLSKHPLYLSVSYETDLLAMENIAPFASEWLRFASAHPDLAVELRTKSANYRALSDLSPQDNLILAWTLSPDRIARRYEHDTPSFEARLASVKQAAADGWNVRLSFDPVLHTEGWRELYAEMIERTFSEVPPEKIRDISIGVFRIARDYLKKMRRENRTSPIIHYPYEANHGVYTYAKPVEKELVEFVYQQVEKHIKQEHIYTL